MKTTIGQLLILENAVLVRSKYETLNNKKTVLGKKLLRFYNRQAVPVLEEFRDEVEDLADDNCATTKDGYIIEEKGVRQFTPEKKKNYRKEVRLLQNKEVELSLEGVDKEVEDFITELL